MEAEVGFLLIGHLEAGLATIAGFAQFLLESISVFCVITGLVKTVQLVLSYNHVHRRQKPPFDEVRLRFGRWLALALEFQLGADILATTIAPTLEQLVQLALIAVIRTFLNYFLGKEMETEMELEKERLLLAQKEQHTPLDGV